MYQYQIADIHMSVAWENEDAKNKCYHYHDCVVLPRVMEAFRYHEKHEKSDTCVYVRSLKKYAGPESYKKIYNQSYYQTDDRMVMTVYDPHDKDIPAYSISMSNDYSNIEFTPHIKEYEHYDLQWLMYPFEGRALYKGGIVLHGAAVESDKKGIIFTGISGAGKSTQAHLWQKYRDALIINGDCPYIQLSGGVPRVFGTPWCGSSGEAINRSVALNAVVLVKQGEKNALKQLHGNEAYLAVLANVLHSNFDGNSLDLTIKNLNAIIASIRVFELSCTIGEEAVEILDNELRS